MSSEPCNVLFLCTGNSARSILAECLANWDELTGADAPRFDVIVTVCDQAAGEACPVWPGHPVQAHWSIEDPAAAIGERSERLASDEFGEVP